LVAESSLLRSWAEEVVVNANLQVEAEAVGDQWAAVVAAGSPPVAEREASLDERILEGIQGAYQVAFPVAVVQEAAVAVVEEEGPLEVPRDNHRPV
jgi:hypothetical protein